MGNPGDITRAAQTSTMESPLAIPPPSLEGGSTPRSRPPGRLLFFWVLLQWNPGLFDQLAPEREVVSVDLRQALGGRALGGITVALQLLAHVGAVHRRVHLFVQARDDLARQFRLAEDRRALP